MFGLLLIASVLADSIVDIINNDPTSTWVATEYPREIMTTAKLRARLGVEGITMEGEKYVPDNSLPENFDSRKQWSGKILPVRDQASCGSCWAFAAAETAGNRLAINGCGHGHLAPQDLVSCDAFDHGCNGGNPLISWEYMKAKGITTESCMPYVSGNGKVPSCPKTCNNGSAIVRYKASSFSHISASKMQEEVYNHGPYEVALVVYEDFKAYKSGVYKHKTGGLLGGHAVLLVGWGVENGTPYWLIQNSWGPSWGEAGHFKIYRGSNECGIETNAYAGYYKC